MRFEIYNNHNPTYRYCIFLYGESLTVVGSYLYVDKEIMEYLNLSVEDFHGIIIKNNGKVMDNEHYFKSIKDCNSAIIDLEPYLIMEKLMK